MEKLNSKIRITYQSINTSTKITKIEKTTEGFVIFGEGKKVEVSYESERILILLHII